MKANIVLYAKEESRSWASEASGVQRNCCWTSELDAGDSSRNWAAESEPFFRGNWSGKVYGHVFRSWSSKHIWTVRCVFTSVILYFCCKVQIRRGDGGMILYIRYYMDRKFLRCSKYDLWLIMHASNIWYLYVYSYKYMQRLDSEIRARRPSAIALRKGSKLCCFIIFGQMQWEMNIADHTSCEAHSLPRVTERNKRYK